MESATKLYTKMLGLGSDWKIASVALDISKKEVEIHLSHDSKEGYCSECEKQAKVYDYSASRKWRHLDTMQFSTVLIAKTPRVKCSECGVKTAFLPWAAKHSHFTLLFEAFAIEILQISKSIKDACELLNLDWHQARTIMERAVERGMARREEEEVTWLGMDEKSFRKGHNYISVLNDLEQGRVIEVSEGRSSAVAKDLITNGLSDYQREMVCGVSIDMSAPYIKAIREHLINADIVHDKFHISQHLGNAVDITRRQENKKLSSNGDKSLVGTKYDWLRGAKSLSREELRAIEYASARELEVSKAWYLKEFFGYFWLKGDADSALNFFDYWARKVINSGNKPMLKVAKMLHKHMSNILTYFDSYITNAVSEGLNSKIQSLKANARGFRSFKNYRISILFFCGKLKLAP